MDQRRVFVQLASGDKPSTRGEKLIDLTRESFFMFVSIVHVLSVSVWFLFLFSKFPLFKCVVSLLLCFPQLDEDRHDRISMVVFTGPAGDTIVEPLWRPELDTLNRIKRG